MATSIEMFRLAHLKAGTSVYYAGGVVTTRGTVATSAKRADLKKIVRSLKRNLGKPICEQGNATVKIGTEAVPESFIGLMHTDLKDDIADLTGFQAVQSYPDPSIAVDGEIGQVAGIRFVESTLMSPLAGLRRVGHRLPLQRRHARQFGRRRRLPDPHPGARCLLHHTAQG